MIKIKVIQKDAQDKSDPNKKVHQIENVNKTKCSKWKLSTSMWSIQSDPHKTDQDQTQMQLVNSFAWIQTC